MNEILDKKLVVKLSNGAWDSVKQAYVRGKIVEVPCKMVAGKVPGDARAIFVELLEAGGGYPLGHKLQVWDTDIKEAANGPL